MVADLARRAERVRAKEVEPHEDNMLTITNDGRKLALDQRLANPLLPDDEGSKVSACVDNVYRYWEEHQEQRLTQLVFCDLSIPKQDGSFNVYDELRRKLMEKGVPAEEIAYIHDANTEVKKKELFAKVRSGQVRILLGSTFKMGAGTNVQTKLMPFTTSTALGVRAMSDVFCGQRRCRTVAKLASSHLFDLLEFYRSIGNSAYSNS